jgi:hypothetical protein
MNKVFINFIFSRHIFTPAANVGPTLDAVFKNMTSKIKIYRKSRYYFFRSGESAKQAQCI